MSLRKLWDKLFPPPAEKPLFTPENIHKIVLIMQAVGQALVAIEGQADPEVAELERLHKL